MTTTPPPEQHSGTGYGGYGRGMNMMGSMVPGNAELVIYVLAIILVAIIALASLISRGIAKAGKVLER